MLFWRFWIDGVKKNSLNLMHFATLDTIWVMKSREILCHNLGLGISWWGLQDGFFIPLILGNNSFLRIFRKFNWLMFLNDLFDLCSRQSLICGFCIKEMSFLLWSLAIRWRSGWCSSMIYLNYVLLHCWFGYSY